MAKKVISLSLDESTIEGMDELAEKMGISRSMFADMTLKTAVGGQSVGSFVNWLFASAADEKEDDTSFVTAGS